MALLPLTQRESRSNIVKSKLEAREMHISDLNKITRPVVGFVVSQKIFDGLKAKVPLKPGLWEIGFQGPSIVVDPTLPDNDFDAAFTQEAWTERLAKIKST